MFDIKADHITIQGPEKKRKVVTLGYTENISHEGKVATESYECCKAHKRINRFLDF